MQYLISQHPGAEERVAEELGTAGLLAAAGAPPPRAVGWEDLSRLPYLAAVIKEVCVGFGCLFLEGRCMCRGGGGQGREGVREAHPTPPHARTPMRASHPWLAPHAQSMRLLPVGGAGTAVAFEREVCLGRHRIPARCALVSECEGWAGQGAPRRLHAQAHTCTDPPPSPPTPSA